MIAITDKHNCCGCSACVQTCPKLCISFDEDEQGFRYPLVQKERCVDCGLCEKVCPCLNQNEPKKPIKVYAAINPNEEIRMKSSSGGIFTILAEAIIDEGGVVFGARFDDHWEVMHDYTETKDGLEPFRGSKYVQSRIGNTYIYVRKFLNEGRKVLFSGTSCQVAGLKKFLCKEYENLMTVDVVCHGVPSPLVWRDYLSKTKNVTDLKFISMKDKSTGWRQSSYTFESVSGKESELARDNKYQLGFMQNLTLRQSCFNCPAKSGQSGSDISLADFWGVEYFCSTMDDNGGTSLVCVNTLRGEQVFERSSIIYREIEYDSAKIFNPCIENSTMEPANGNAFWHSYLDIGNEALLRVKSKKSGLFKRIVRRIIK